MIAFNTGRDYTAQGQRIAATQTESGNIVLLDIDRHIDIMLPVGVEFTKADILWAYDLNMQTFPNEVGMDYSDYYAIVRTLQAAAEAI